MDMERLYPMIIVGLLGTTGGGGVTTYLQSNHLHPEIIAEIRAVEYEMEIERTNLLLVAMEQSDVPRDSASYISTTNKLSHFEELLQDLKK